MSQPSDRRFGLTMAAALTVLALWPHRPRPVRLGLLGVAAVLCIAGIVMPRSLQRAHRAWMALGHAMQRVTTPVVIAVGYYLVLTPTALLMRLCRVDNLRRRPDPALRTYWIDRPSRAVDRAAISRPF